MKSSSFLAMLLFMIVALFAVGGSGKPWAMEYSPFNPDKSCNDPGTISSDIGTIASKGFQGVRIYSVTDCSALQNIGGAARASGLWIITTVYISQSGTGDAQAQIDALLGWAQWDLTKFIVIGNEAIHNNWVSASDLASFISDSRSKFQAANYWGPIGTTDTVDVIQNNAGILCGVCDVVSANIHPFFNPAISASSAGDFVSRQLNQLQQFCSGKDAYNLEVGWPTAGNTNGAAVPGFNEQQEAISSIRAAAEDRSVFFSYE